MIEDALYNFNEPVTPNAVEAAVSRLRRKLDEAGATGALHTIRGVGYMLKDVAVCPIGAPCRANLREGLLSSALSAPSCCLQGSEERSVGKGCGNTGRSGGTASH